MPSRRSAVYVNEAECDAAGLPVAKVKQVARKLEQALAEANRMGMTLFCGGTQPTLRFDDQGPGKLVLAGFAGDADGGDGMATRGADGLERGES